MKLTRCDFCKKEKQDDNWRHVQFILDSSNIYVDICTDCTDKKFPTLPKKGITNRRPDLVGLLVDMIQQVIDDQ